MRHRILPIALLAALAAGPAPAQPADEADEGLSLIERGIGMIFRQFWQDAAPEVEGLTRDLSGTMTRLAPALQDLAVLVDDIRNYDPPERLENGDILIRRRAGAPPPPPIGDDLKDLTEPAPEAVPIDPDAPQISL
nr:hypothetical protein [Paracoccus saliphilus]